VSAGWAVTFGQRIKRNSAAADKVAVRARYLGMLEGCLAQEAKLAA